MSYPKSRSREPTKGDVPMELSNQIKKYRTALSLSQEELAEKVFVTRQTVSNWETEKSYPDIHSLLLLSNLFEVSLDQLIKGDIDIMKEEIKENEVTKLNHYGNIFSVLLLISVLSFVPFTKFFGLYGLAASILLWGSSMFFAFKVERIKKDNNIQSYKEIVAFMDGKRLDEIETLQEKAKVPYQNFLKVLISALVGAGIAAFFLWIL